MITEQQQRITEVLVAFAKNSKLLSALDREGLLSLARHAVIQEVREGDVIVTQGDAGNTFYLIATGEVSIRVREAGNKEVARLGAGMFFGEIAVITKQPRSATVVATQASRMLCFPRAPLIELLRGYPALQSLLSSVGLARTEENLRHAQAGDSGLAELLEGDEPTGLSELLEGEEPLVVNEMDEDDPLEEVDDQPASDEDEQEPQS